MKKRLISIVLAVLLLLSLMPTAFASEEIKVYVDGQKVFFDVPPQIMDGRTMVPLRAIFESLGAQVFWDESTRTVTAFRGSDTVKCTIGSYVMDVNGTSKSMDIAPMIVDSRTLVPARFVAEAFGSKVDWEGDTRSVIISTSALPGEMPLQDFCQMMEGIWVDLRDPFIPFDLMTGEAFPDDVLWNRYVIEGGNIQMVYTSGEMAQRGQIVEAVDYGNGLYKMTIFYPGGNYFEEYVPDTYATVMMRKTDDSFILEGEYDEEYIYTYGGKTPEEAVAFARNFYRDFEDEECRGTLKIEGNYAYLQMEKEVGFFDPYMGDRPCFDDTIQFERVSEELIAHNEMLVTVRGNLYAYKGGAMYFNGEDYQIVEASGTPVKKYENGKHLNWENTDFETAYEEAGGVIERILFQNEAVWSAIWYSDMDVLEEVSGKDISSGFYLCELDVNGVPIRDQGWNLYLSAREDGVTFYLTNGQGNLNPTWKYDWEGNLISMQGTDSAFDAFLKELGIL